MIALAPPIPTGQDNVLVYVVLAVLGTPVLSFLLSLTRAKVDKNNVIVTGASAAVNAISESMEDLRTDLQNVRADNRELREELDSQDTRHKAQIAQIRAEHRQEVASMNAAHRAQMAELRAQRDDLAAMVRRGQARRAGEDVPE